VLLMQVRGSRDTPGVPGAIYLETPDSCMPLWFRFFNNITG
jgi:hypothetical protein